LHFSWFSSSHKGYKCLDVHGKLFISKDVLFDENTFPFLSQSTPPSRFAFHSRTIPLGILPNVGPSFPIQHASLESPDVSTVSPVSSTSPNITRSSPLPPPIVPITTSTHPMQTRSKSGIVKLKQYPTLLLTITEPASIKHALSSSIWRSAVQEEYNALMANNTWTLTSLPPGRKSIGCKWIFRVKENADGTINKYKACLVAKGFHQKYGCDYTESFSPIVKPVTVRLILTLAITNQWPLQQIDVNNGFLNDLLHEEVYMDPPPDFLPFDSNLVCKLHKSIYGLKQAPRAWYERLTSTLISFGFVNSKCDPSLLVLNTTASCLYVLVPYLAKLDQISKQCACRDR